MTECRRLRRFAAQALFMAFVTSVLLGCIQNFFYYPTRDYYETPANAGLKFEEVAFASDDGTRLSGWFIPAITGKGEGVHGTVIQFHGNAQNISSHWRLVEWLPRRGYNLFVFDYRGYGKSQGSPQPRGVFEDSVGALKYIRTRADVDPAQIFVIGQSLGGTNAIAAVGSGSRQGVRAMVIEATFYSYTSIANEKLPGSGLFIDDTYSAERFVDKLAPIPVLFIHGTRDDVIPHAHSERLYQKASEPKHLTIIEGGAHIEAFLARFGTKYQDQVTTFFQSAVAKR